ncbi:MAG: universal stress protein [Sphingomonadales bacterium]|nr:universal stress protein [Sphingomonadales bacterium]
MRSILVQAGRDAGMASRLDTAMGIARIHGGHLTVLIDTPVDRFVTVDPYGGTYVAREAFETALAEDDALAAAFAGRLSKDDVPFDVALYETQPIEAMANAARLADLAIVSRDCGFAGDLPLEARCPVLVLPGRAALEFPLASACVAWDGGLEAAYALRSAVPLLKGCAAVRVITVLTEKSTDFPATEALRYLSRHGISAELVEVNKGATVEETLAATVQSCKAQLLVMGAYGHSRVREFLFGGVSRYFLQEATSPPLLLAH